MKKVYWKAIPGYEGLYEANNYGDIKSLNYRGSGKEKILKQSIIKGYKHIILYKDGNIKNYYVHQLICMTFLGHSPDGHIMVVDHKDNNGTNNYIGTLEGEWKDGNLHVVPHRDNYSTCARKDRYTKSTEYYNVSFDKNSKKWKSSIEYNGKQYHLGLYLNKDDSKKESLIALSHINEGTFYEYITKLKIKLKENIGVKINQYSKSGEFIREWNNVSEASKELNIKQSNISSCCNNKLKTAYNFIWKYKE